MALTCNRSDVLDIIDQYLDREGKCNITIDGANWVVYTDNTPTATPVEPSAVIEDWLHNYMKRHSVTWETALEQLTYGYYTIGNTVYSLIGLALEGKIQTISWTELLNWVDKTDVDSITCSLGYMEEMYLRVRDDLNSTLEEL